METAAAELGNGSGGTGGAARRTIPGMRDEPDRVTVEGGRRSPRWLGMDDPAPRASLEPPLRRAAAGPFP